MKLVDRFIKTGFTLQAAQLLVARTERQVETDLTGSGLVPEDEDGKLRWVTLELGESLSLRIRHPYDSPEGVQCGDS